MNLTELSIEYRSIGETCRARLREQERALRCPGLSEAERALTRRRITLLTAIVREMIATSIYLERYYGRNVERYKGRNAS